MFDPSVSEEERQTIAGIATSIKGDAKIRRSAIPVAPGFSALEKYDPTTGDHALVPLGNGDLREPCPGLKAMANHACIPHNGVATITEFIQGTYMMVREIAFQN
jgi:hypothetical protein